MSTMNTLKNCLAAFALMLGTLAAAQTVTPTRQGVKIDNAGQGFCTEVMFYSPSIVRIVKYPCPPPATDKPGLESLSVIMKPESTKFSLKEQEGRVVLASSEVTVTVDKQTGTLRFADRQGRSLLAEQGKPFLNCIKVMPTKETIKWRRPSSWTLTKPSTASDNCKLAR